MNTVVAIQGLQFGSEAKGNIASVVAAKWHPDTVATAWGPNAGHTAWVNGVKYVHTMLPVGALAPTVENILLGPGSVIDVQKLSDEITAAGTALLGGKTLIIHPQAALLLDWHRTSESALIKIGSTMKGTMAAAIHKMNRSLDNTNTVGLSSLNLLAQLFEALRRTNMAVSLAESHYDRAIDHSSRLMLEGAQGYSLGIHTGFYPYTTSRDVSTAQLLADCRIPLPGNLITIGVARTYPIRVANRLNTNGDTVGTSGTCYVDQHEMKWEEIDHEPELTTVTKLPRRLFTFSKIQLEQACRVMRPDFLALTFCDYYDPKVETITQSGPGSEPNEKLQGLIDTITGIVGQGLALLSFGPQPSDVYRYQWGTAMSLAPIVDELPFLERHTP